ncbi:hypothetical protein JADG_009739 [Aureobasidium aubasidani]|nr:hypothetical protein JADG_009739 [Aureobasidium pullulans]
MAFQALRDEVVYYYGYSQGRGFSISDILSRSSAKMLSQVSSLMTIPLPLLSFLAVPFFGSSSTTISLAFFLLTWVTLVSTHDPLYLELIGTLTIRIIFFVLPSLAVLGFDTLIPSLSASIKTRGAAQLPTQLSSRRLRNVLFVSIFNVAFSVFAQGACDYVLTEVLNIRSAIRVSKIPPAPWPTMVKEVLYGLVCRGFLHYFIHRDILHASPRGSILARWHADWAHSLKHPFSLTATYDHPICHLLTDWAPLYLTTLFFRFHVLTWYILTAIVSLEQFFIYSGYSVLPSQILLAGMAQRTDSHYATGGKGNYGHWGVLDWIFGTGCPGDADVMDDVQEEADKRGVRQRASNMMENAEDRVRRASDKEPLPGAKEEQETSSPGLVCQLHTVQPVSATLMLKSPFIEIQQNTTTRLDNPDILISTMYGNCGRKSEKSGTIYDWEERLAYVGVDDLDEDREEDQGHDEELTLERSCGVMSFLLFSPQHNQSETKHTFEMVDHEENNNEPGGPLSPNMVARLRTAIANNPQRTTSFLVTTLLTICPALLTGPLLTLLGFGGLGPAAGGLAAGFQGWFGTPWVFRVLQSAAMGGWGSALIQGIVRAFSAGGLVLALIKNILGRDEEGEDHEEENEGDNEE